MGGGGPSLSAGVELRAAIGPSFVASLECSYATEIGLQSGLRLSAGLFSVPLDRPVSSRPAAGKGGPFAVLCSKYPLLVPGLSLIGERATRARRSRPGPCFRSWARARASARPTSSCPASRGGAPAQPRPTPLVAEVPAEPLAAEQPELGAVFPVFRKYYDANPVGKIVVHNASSEPISNLRASFLVRQYMDIPKASPVLPELGPEPSVKPRVAAVSASSTGTRSPGTTTGAPRPS